MEYVAIWKLVGGMDYDVVVDSGVEGRKIRAVALAGNGSLMCKGGYRGI